MKKKKRIWVVEFEEPNGDLINDEWFGIMSVEKDGIVHYYHRRKSLLLGWKLREIKEV